MNASDRKIILFRPIKRCSFVSPSTALCIKCRFESISLEKCNVNTDKDIINIVYKQTNTESLLCSNCKLWGPGRGGVEGGARRARWGRGRNDFLKSIFDKSPRSILLPARYRELFWLIIGYSRMIYTSLCAAVDQGW